MNQHINRIISQIHTLQNEHVLWVPSVNLKQFENESYYNKYFSGIDLSPDELSPSVNTEFRRRMKLAIEQIANDLKTTSTLLFVLTPFTYFLGSLLRDVMIDFSEVYPNSIEYIGIYIFWIGIFIIMPLAFGFDFYIGSRILKELLKLEFDVQSETIHSGSTIVNSASSKSHKERLVELEALLAENLISSDEYKLKKKEILKDL
jgi:hypothetical protein